ncbi:DUF5060 domain-containing protein [Planctomycetota bacterium]
MKKLGYFEISLFIISILSLSSCRIKGMNRIHLFEIEEIVLTAQNRYENPYTDVECWVELKGPGFNKRIYGFWDGGQVYKVRIAATQSGVWSWK